MGRLVNIYQRNQIAKARDMLRKWGNIAKDLRIQELNKSIHELSQQVKSSESRHGEDRRYESENLSNFQSEMFPPVSPMSNKTRSVMNILSSRNMRNKNKSNSKPLANKTKLIITEIDEDKILDPPTPHNPFKHSYDSKSMTQPIDFSRELSGQPTPPIYDRLYSDARLKEAKIREYQLIKKEDDLTHCTFKPNISRSASRARSAQSRIHQLAISTKNAKEEMYRNRRENKEIEGCTFHPNITNISSVRNSTLDHSKNIFEKLYEENEAKKRYKRNLEIENQNKDIQGCTFRPQTLSSTQSFVNDSFGSLLPNRNSEVFNRLYKESDNIKRKKIKLEMDQKNLEISKYSFQPERVTKYKDTQFGLESEKTDRTEIYERLYRDAEIKESRLENKQKQAERELAEMSRFSSLSFKHSGKLFIVISAF